jgi:signal peptidase I
MLAKEVRFMDDEKNTQTSSDNNTPSGGNTAALKPAGAVSEVYDWVSCIVAALLICVTVFVFFARVVGVIGSSMVPTLHDTDKVIISDLFYKPEYGDIVVLRKETFDEKPIVKRVIATEGQTVNIDFERGIVYVDGEALEENYINDLTHNAIDFEGEITVPEGQVFVMGDNRNRSTDSRDDRIGCVDTRYIMGKVLLRIWPISSFGSVY